jgi:hypothetical protein
MAIQEKGQGEGLKESIMMAFNLGVWMRQQKGHGVGVLEAGKELRDMIYWNISQGNGKEYPDDLVSANVEYFLEIALLGYILPEVSLPDEELKNKLISLIDAKSKGNISQSAEQFSTSLPRY